MVATLTRAVAYASAALIVMAAPSAGQVTAFIPQLETTRLAEGVYHISAGPDGYVPGMNMVFVVNDNDVLVFDTSTRPSTARAALAEIRKVTDKPVRYVVNSHWHPDHWSGNQVFVDAFPSVEIVATAQTKIYMQNMGNFFAPRFAYRLAQAESTYARQMRTGKDDDGSVMKPQQRAEETAAMIRYRTFVSETQTVQRTYPTLAYVDELRLERGAREIVLMSVTGDAEGTTVMYIPSAKVLVTGDAVSYPLPYTTPPPSRHARSLRMLSQLDVDVIVPGHGPAFRDKKFLALEAELLETAVQRVRVSLRKGLATVAEVQKDVSLDDFRVRFTNDDPALNREFAGFANGVIRIAYLESRDNQESRP